MPDNALTIYPNPAKEIITVEVPKSIISNNYGSISFYGLTGQELRQQKMQGSTTEINVSSLPTGIYFVKYVSQGYTETGKFVKE